ncbi:MAG TPA: VCBS repeat-containing protein [Myxococcota bacterium]|nr:VCBS repeat-containing protein [Myxococcota bacterium]HRY92505.1 VCBS repeat-containing protein [Myxococcota bacterium]
MRAYAWVACLLAAGWIAACDWDRNAICLLGAVERPGNGVDEDCDGETDECDLPADCEDGNPCTEHLCLERACDTIRLEDGEPCPDGVFCNGAETCQGGVCVGGDAPDCAELDDDCHQGSCDAASDACVAVTRPDSYECDDHLFCTILDACQAGVCQGVANPCDDGAACTLDTCQANPAGCLHEWRASPGVLELCGDGLDQNCDRQPDGCCLGQGELRHHRNLAAFEEGHSTASVMGADLNADGLADLVFSEGSALPNPNRIGIALGMDDPVMFQSPFFLEVGRETQELARADLNADGVQDLAVVCTQDDTHGQVRFLLGQGNGSLAPTPQVIDVVGRPADVVLLDVSSDGIADLLVTGLYAGGSCATPGSLQIWLGNGQDGRGDGTFRLDPAAPAVPLGLGSRDILPLHADGDGILDLAISMSGILDSAACPGTAVWILKGGGAGGRADGTFQKADELEAGLNPYELAGGDFNADGRTDLAVCTMRRTEGTRTQDLYVFYGNGDATFSGGPQIAPVALLDGDPSPATRRLQAADLNQDGILDLVAAHVDRRSLSYALGRGQDGRGDGTFFTAVEVDEENPPGPVGGTFWGMDLLDANFDGIPDVVAADRVSNKMAVFLGLGRGARPLGSFAQAGPIPLGAPAGALLARDLNLDRVPDLITLHPADGAVRVALGAGSRGRGLGSWGPALRSAVCPGVQAAALADLDGDRALELVAACPQSGQVAVLPGSLSAGQPTGGFGAARTFAAGARPAGLALADLDADALLDLAVALEDEDRVAVLLGQGLDGHGDGAFGPAWKAAVPAGPTALAAADLDRDAIPDLVVASPASGSLAVLLGQGAGGRGDGTFDPAVVYDPGCSPAGVAVADIGGDFIPDLVATCAEGGLVSLPGQGSDGRGDGTFGAPVRLQVGAGSGALVLADLDRDNILDAVAASPADDSVQVMPGAGQSRRPIGRFLPGTSLPAGGPALDAVLVDVDGNSVLDLLVVVEDSPALQLWLGQATCLPPL